MTEHEMKELAELAAQDEGDNELVEWTDRDGGRWVMESGRAFRLGKSPRECNALRVALKRGMTWVWPAPPKTHVGGRPKPDDKLSPQQESARRAQRKALPGAAWWGGRISENGRFEAGEKAADQGSEGPGKRFEWHGPTSKFLNQERERIAACETPQLAVRRLVERMIAWQRTLNMRAEREARRQRLRARGFQLS